MQLWPVVFLQISHNRLYNLHQRKKWLFLRRMTCILQKSFYQRVASFRIHQTSLMSLVRKKLTTRRHCQLSTCSPRRRKFAQRLMKTAKSIWRKKSNWAKAESLVCICQVVALERRFGCNLHPRVLLTDGSTLKTPIPLKVWDPISSNIMRHWTPQVVSKSVELFKQGARMWHTRDRRQRNVAYGNGRNRLRCNERILYLYDALK